MPTRTDGNYKKNYRSSNDSSNHTNFNRKCIKLLVRCNTLHIRLIGKLMVTWTVTTALCALIFIEDLPCIFSAICLLTGGIAVTVVTGLLSGAVKLFAGLVLEGKACCSVWGSGIHW